MRIGLSIIVTVIAAVGLACLAVTRFLPPEAQAVLLPCIAALGVLAAGVAAGIIRLRNARRSRSEEPDSLEHEVSVFAQAGSMRDALLVGLALALVSLLIPGVPPALGPLAIVAFLVVDFWVR